MQSMKQITYSNSVNAVIDVIPSKSIILRVLTAIYLSGKKSKVVNRSRCEDEKSALQLLKTLGVRIKIDESIQFEEFTENINRSISFGESGFLTRTFSLILAAKSNGFKVDGFGSLKKRKFYDLLKVLKKLDVNIESSNSKLPFKINGPITKKDILIDCSDTSQILSGLLLLFSSLEGDSIIKVNNLVSKPYINLTLDTLRRFGVEIQNRNYKTFFIKGNKEFKKMSYKVEGDWSNAAFWAVLAALKGKIVLTNLNIDSKQGDKIILEILKQAGASVSIRRNKVSVEKNNLKSFEFDATDYPDLVPVLTVLALNCSGISRISGISRLINKESNRLKSIMKELQKLGANLEVDEDTLIVKESRLHSGTVRSHNDHRIAMALAIAGKNIKGGIKLKNWLSVNKSYPGFFKILESL